MVATDLSSLSPSEKAQLAKNNNRAKYDEVLRRNFGYWRPTVQKVVAKLPYLRVNHVITTNYDDSLFENFQNHGFQRSVIPNIHNLQLRSDKFVFNIHGLINSDERDDISSIVLSTDDYEKYYGEGKLLTMFLSESFLSYNLVFIGVSFDDEDVVKVLQRVCEIESNVDYDVAGIKRPTRLALMGIPIEKSPEYDYINISDIERKRRLLKDLRILPLWYDSSGHHEELSIMVQEVVNGIGPSDPIKEQQIRIP